MIIASSKGLSNARNFELQNTKNGLSLKTLVGETLGIGEYTLYDVLNDKNETIKVLSFVDDKGRVISTNAKIVVETFLAAHECTLDGTCRFKSLSVTSRDGKNGRPYLVPEISLEEVK